MSARYPNIWRIGHLIDCAMKNSACIDGHYVPARPLGFASFGRRVRAAALVFSGKADAVIWDMGQ